MGCGLTAPILVPVSLNKRGRPTSGRCQRPFYGVEFIVLNPSYLLPGFNPLLPPPGTVQNFVMPAPVHRENEAAVRDMLDHLHGYPPLFFVSFKPKLESWR